MSLRLLAGFIPLVDAAPLVAAAENGFAAAEGIELQLVRQPSWASLRDHLNLGHIDCAQALAPLPIAAALGVGQVQADMVVPFVLSRGGNAITLSTALADRIREGNGGSSPQGASDWARGLAIAIRQRRNPVTLAMVYPFSGHNFELRYWLAAAGVHPDRDLRLVAIPPPLMVESLRAGHIDGFCVGEPWNSLGAADRIGEIVATKSEIFPHGIEKVLAMPSVLLADSAASAALLRALASGASWCDRPENHASLADLLARPEYLGADPELCLNALDGRLPVDAMGSDSEFLYFSRHDANRPRRQHALWIYAQMLRWGQIPASSAAEERAAAVYREDCYAQVFGRPYSDESEPVSACDVVESDSAVSEYLQGFDLSTPYGLDISNH